MKTYKIYAQCVINARPIQEIDEEEAKNLICKAVDEMIDNRDIQIDNIDEDDDDRLNEEIEKLYDRAIKYYEEIGAFWCGDFAVEKTDDPVRGNMYGYDTSF